MRMETFIRHVRLPVSAEETFAWHARPGALERMFRYRHDTAAADLAIHAKHADRR